jgi:thiol-disulfide isomerase/thioredoxin
MNIMDALKKKYILPALALIVVLAAVYVALGNQSSQDGITVGSKAKNVQVQLLNGEKVKLSDFRGKLLVVDFMAPWCDPCKEELQILGQVYGQTGVEIISINVDPSYNATELSAFAEEHGIVWNFGSSSQAAIDYKVTAIPNVFLIDKQGVIRYQGNYTPLSQFLDLFKRFG